MLSQPAISQSHLVFVYAGNLWAAGLDGRNVRRLTSGQGVSSPAFSPDGTLVAFTAQYEGNADVYVVPVTGGVPTRLTWHPGRDAVQGFTPDGSAVVFTSARAVFSGRYTQMFTVPVKGGAPVRLDPPYAFRGALSPDGTRIAYNPLYDAFTQWKHYRGGTHSTIWIYATATRAVEVVPQPSDRPNDVYPMWIGQTLYFVSDRAGEFNLFSYDSKSKTVRQLTSHEDFPILWASAGAGKVVYEQAGFLHVFDPADGKHAKVTIGVTADLPDLRPRFVKGARYIRGGALSPSGARVALEFRGEIVTVPAEKGDPRNLTNTPGVHERTPAWSPDGRSVAYLSDAGGGYQLVVAPQDGKGNRKSHKLPGAGFYGRPVWSPDNKRIAYTDNSASLFWIDLATGVSKKIASEPVYGPFGMPAPSWSADSKWLAYTLNTPSHIQQVHLYSLDRDTSSPVTDGLSDVSEPVFDAGGKYLLHARVDRRRPGARLVRHVERRHAGDKGALRRRAREGHAVAAREGERRGEGKRGTEGGARPRGRKGRGQVGRCEAGGGEAGARRPGRNGRLRGARQPDTRPPGPGCQSLQPPDRRIKPALLPPLCRREVGTAPLQSRHAQGRGPAAGGEPLSSVSGWQEAPLSQRRELGHRPGQREDRGRSGAGQPGRRRGPHRSARRVAAESSTRPGGSTATTSTTRRCTG